MEPENPVRGRACGVGGAVGNSENPADGARQAAQGVFAETGMIVHAGQCTRMESLHQQGPDSRHDGRHVPVHGPDCGARQVVAGVIPLGKEGHPLGHGVPRPGERLLQFCLPIPEDIAHSPFLLGSRASGTCGSAEDYLAAAGPLLGSTAGSPRWAAKGVCRRFTEPAVCGPIGDKSAKIGVGGHPIAGVTSWENTGETHRVSRQAGRGPLPCAVCQEACACPWPFWHSAAFRD